MAAGSNEVVPSVRRRTKDHVRGGKLVKAQRNQIGAQVQAIRSDCSDFGKATVQSVKGEIQAASQVSGGLWQPFVDQRLPRAETRRLPSGVKPHDGDMGSQRLQRRQNVRDPLAVQRGGLLGADRFRQPGFDRSRRGVLQKDGENILRTCGRRHSHAVKKRKKFRQGGRRTVSHFSTHCTSLPIASGRFASLVQLKL